MKLTIRNENGVVVATFPEFYTAKIEKTEYPYWELIKFFEKAALNPENEIIEKEIDAIKHWLLTSNYASAKFLHAINNSETFYDLRKKSLTDLLQELNLLMRRDNGNEISNEIFIRVFKAIISEKKEKINGTNA
jgi:hypothetical protein